MAKFSLVLWLDRCKRSILATFGHKLLLDFDNDRAKVFTDDPLVSVDFSTCVHSATFRPLWYHPHKPIKKESALLVHGETFMLVLFPILVPVQQLQIAYPMKSIKKNTLKNKHMVMSVIPTFWSLSWRNPHPNF